MTDSGDQLAKMITALEEFKEPGEKIQDGKGFTIHPNSLIEDYFKFVAKNGKTGVEWSKVRNAFLWKLKTVIDDMKTKSQSDESFKENEDENKLEEMTEFIYSRAESFENAPFTIQRICELLIWPDKHYSSLGKFLRALEKTINIISCVMPDGDRVINMEDIDMEEESDESDIRVESSFIVRVDELELDKSLTMIGPQLKDH